jgi:nephrocystin-4
MDQKQLYVDVWNGDSLLLLGTACVDLKMGLRQGKPAIIVDQDIDIIWSEVYHKSEMYFLTLSVCG